MTNIYEEGDQPCDNFNPQDGSMPGITNQHECYHGCDKSHSEKIHHDTVSFCDNCAYDHHAYGWDSCAKYKQKNNTPLKESQ